MILKISNDNTITEGVVSIPYSWLNNKSVHLYLACNKWDKLEVDMSEEIPEGVLKYIIMKSSDKEVKLMGEVTPKVCSLICEMFPEKAGAVRKAVMLKRNLSTVLGDSIK